MDERKVKRIYHPPAVPAADLFKGGKQRRVAVYSNMKVSMYTSANAISRSTGNIHDTSPVSHIRTNFTTEQILATFLS